MSLLGLLKSWLNAPPSSPPTSAAGIQLQNRSMMKIPAHPPRLITDDTLAKSEATNQAPLRTARLIMVSAHNNNKFYEMKELADGTFQASYGRVGSSASSMTYPIVQWDKKLKEKLRKGYVDQTYLFATETTDTGLSSIEHPGVKELMAFLMRAARQSIRHNYHVSADQVTPLQIDQAQAILDQLVTLVPKGKKVKTFNELLLNLYQIIPRKMTRVQDHLVKQLNNQADRKTVDELLASEQATLDVMRGQVKVNAQRKGQEEETKQDLLQTMGLRIEPVTEEDSIQNIRKMMGRDARKFSSSLCGSKSANPATI